MKTEKWQDGVKLHIENTDGYEVTDDNGVDVWLSNEQILQIIATRIQK